VKLEGAHAVVTGGASGIGRALAQRFAAEGARAVCVADLDEAGARAVAAEVGGLGLRVDVAREDDLRALVEAAERAHGPIDLFCSNAGIFTAGGVDASDADWERNLSIHVLSHVYAARAVLPGMIARGSGYLLQTASAAGLLSQIGSAPYTVTKHAAVALAEWIAIEHHHQGIRVSVLCPQAVRTAMTAGVENGGVAGVDGMIEAEDVARCVIEALAEERFLILPHPEVQEYVRRKAGDRERWLTGMRRLRERFGAAAVPVPRGPRS